MYHRHEQAKRRVALVAGAVLCSSQALSVFLDWSVPQPVEMASSGGILLPLYGLTWAGAALLCLGFCWSGRLVTPMGAVVGLCMAWGGVFGLAWVTHTSTGWWRSALVYWAMGVMASALTALTPAIPRPSERTGQ